MTVSLIFAHQKDVHDFFVFMNVCEYYVATFCFMNKWYVVTPSKCTQQWILLLVCGMLLP